MKDHVRHYIASNGREGHLFAPPGTTEAVPTLLLATTGRRSGEKFIFPLIYGQDGHNYVVVASKGGAPDDPGWYRNLVQTPQVSFQVAEKTFTGTARTAMGAERARLWAQMAALFPNYENYQKQTPREIPVVVLEPANG